MLVLKFPEFNKMAIFYLLLTYYQSGMKPHTKMTDFQQGRGIIWSLRENAVIYELKVIG